MQELGTAWRVAMNRASRHAMLSDEARRNIVLFYTAFSRAF